MFLFIYFSLSIVHILATKPPVRTCPNGVITFNHPPTNSTETVWYPEKYGSVAPNFPSNFTCQYQINVPKNVYAEIEFKTENAIVQKGPFIQIIDPVMGPINIYFAPDKHFFIAPGGKILLNSQDREIGFGFKIKWSYYPTSATSPQKVSFHNPNPQVFQKEFGMGTVEAKTRVSATIMPIRNDDWIDIYRGILFFDGPTPNSKCLGNGEQLLEQNTQFVSTGSSMTIVYLGEGRPSIIVQDYENTKDVVEFQGTTCNRKRRDCGSITLNGTYGPSILQTISDEFDEEEFEVVKWFNGKGQLDVHVGGRVINKKNLIASYSYNESKLLFPQKFYGKIKTYEATHGIVDVFIGRQPSDNFYGAGAWERKGFCTSKNYGMISKDQDSFTVIKSPGGGSVIRFDIQNVDLSGSAELSVRGYHERTLVYLLELTAENIDLSEKALRESNKFFFGDTLNVEYRTDGIDNKGFWMDYHVERGSAATFSMIVFAFVAWLLY